MKIILIGFMGSGKSTIGALLAQSLKYSFVEMDSEIINQSGCQSITEIFERFDEPHFRDLETKVAQSLTNTSNVVISAGGGTPCREENMHALKSGDAIVIYLDASIDTIRTRITDTSTRPLFKDKEKTEALFTTRKAIYQKYADTVVDANDSETKILSKITLFLGERGLCQ